MSPAPKGAVQVKHLALKDLDGAKRWGGICAIQSKSKRPVSLLMK